MENMFCYQCEQTIEKLDLHPISTPEQDLTAILGNTAIP